MDDKPEVLSNPCGGPRVQVLAAARSPRQPHQGLCVPIGQPSASSLPPSAHRACLTLVLEQEGQVSAREALGSTLHLGACILPLPRGWAGLKQDCVYEVQAPTDLLFREDSPLSTPIDREDVRAGMGQAGPGSAIQGTVQPALLMGRTRTEGPVNAQKPTMLR